MTAAPPEILTMDAALWCRRGSPPRMDAMHRHNDIEINIVLAGQLNYLVSGRHVVVGEGQIAAFWAAQPHGLVDSRPGDVCWVHVPLATVIGWGLPEAELRSLIRMEPLVIDAGDLRERLASMVSLWLREISEAETAEFALLEIQAALRRIIRAADDRRPGDKESGASPPPDRTRHALRMAEFVLERFREELSIEQIARSAHLAPSHAMTVFREAVGVTIGEYLTMSRVAEAQRLLLTTTKTSTEIAREAGFGSLSSFYAHVTAACGMSPRRFRRQGR